MALDFPSSPTLGPPPTTYGRWVWNGTSWVSAPAAAQPYLALTGGTLTGPGNLGVDGNLGVGGMATLQADASVGGDLSVAGGVTTDHLTTTGTSLDVAGSATIGGTLDVAGDVTLSTDLAVHGDADFAADLAVAGGLTVAGDPIATQNDVNDAVDAVKNLGLYAGSFATRAAVPTNRSGFPGGITANDFITVRADETTTPPGATTRYVATNIAANGDITWTYDISYSTDISGKMDLVPAADGQLATFDSSGQVEGGDAPSDGRIYARRNDAWQTPPVVSSERDAALPRTNMMKIRHRSLVHKIASGNLDFHPRPGNNPNYIFLDHRKIGYSGVSHSNPSAVHRIDGVAYLDRALSVGWTRKRLHTGAYTPTAPAQPWHSLFRTMTWTIPLTPYPDYRPVYVLKFTGPYASVRTPFRLMFLLQRPPWPPITTPNRRSASAQILIDTSNLNGLYRWVQYGGAADAADTDIRNGIGFKWADTPWLWTRRLMARYDQVLVNRTFPNGQFLMINIEYIMRPAPWQTFISVRTFDPVPFHKAPPLS